MAMAIQRTAIDLWAGEDTPDEPQRTRLADAVRAVTAALGEVLTAPSSPAGLASAGPEAQSADCECQADPAPDPLTPAGSVPRPTR